VERSATEVRLSVEQAMAREVTPDWLLPRLETALAEDDRDRIAMLAGLAAEHGIPLDPATQARVDAALADPGFLEGAADCATCAIDIRSCESLPQIAACAIPFELTPFGDLNALRRQSTAWLYGEEVDEIETGLALAGLAATGAVVASGGGSYVVKGGLSALRSARRMGALTPGFTRVLGEAADLPVNWGAVLRAAPLSEITDTARLARLTGIGEDLADGRRPDVARRHARPPPPCGVGRGRGPARPHGRRARPADPRGDGGAGPRPRLPQSHAGQRPRASRHRPRRRVPRAGRRSLRRDRTPRRAPGLALTAGRCASAAGLTPFPVAPRLPPGHDGLPRGVRPCASSSSSSTTAASA
jgi:hypothetical protein